MASIQSPGLFRRLAVVLYDSLVMLAVLFLATALALPVTHGQAVAAESPAFQFYLLAVLFLYLGWFWTRAGQTVAMRAWRLQVVGVDGRRIGWGRAWLRFAAALLPVVPSLLWLNSGPQVDTWIKLTALLVPWLCGFVWVLFDPERRAWHDILSATRMLQQPQAGRLD